MIRTQRLFASTLLVTTGLLAPACSHPDSELNQDLKPSSSAPAATTAPDDQTSDTSADEPNTEPDNSNKTPSGPTYYGAAKAIIDRKCANCHRKDDIAPFELDNYQSIYDIRPLVEHSVRNETMPPWPPRRDCQEYMNDRSLTAEEKSVLLQWLENGAPEGDPSEFSKDSSSHKEVDFNLTLKMPEPYTPRGRDDNRCFLVPWPGEKQQFQRAFQVEPGEASMLHHLLVYKVPAVAAAAFHAIDAADLGPGYYCPGGPAPGIHPNGVELIGDWVPGQIEGELPDGVGITYNPGDLLIMQHHYNTAFTGPKPDQSTYKFKFVDQVKRPAVASLFFNPAWLVPGAMAILPGVKDTVHKYTFGVTEVLGTMAMARIPGYTLDKPLQVRMTGAHLHEIGSQAYVRVIRADGSQECIVDVPEWDFDWQGFYHIDSRLILNPGDRIELECHWDNTAENQPTLEDGSRRNPTIVGWGDRTEDEMCLVGIMVTAVDEDNGNMDDADGPLDPK